MKKIHRLFALITFCFAVGSVSAGIKVATYNIRTFDYKNSYTNKVELKKNIQALKADFITVEEIVNAASFQAFIKKEFKNYSVYLSRCGGGGKQKVGFVYRKDKYTLEKIYEDNRLSDPGNVVGQYGEEQVS